MYARKRAKVVGMMYLGSVCIVSIVEPELPAVPTHLSVHVAMERDGDSLQHLIHIIVKCHVYHSASMNWFSVQRYTFSLIKR